MDGGAVQQGDRARQEGLRRVHLAGLVLARAREGVRLLDLVLLREPGGGRAQGHADREGQDDEGPQGVHARRTCRHHELQLHHEIHQARAEAEGLRLGQRHHRRPQGEADRRPRGRLPEHRLHHGGPGPGGEGRRQAAQDGEEEREDEDEDLGDQEDLHVRLERGGDLGQRVAELAPVEERPLGLRPAGRVDDRDRDDREEDDRAGDRDGDAPAAGAAGVQAAEDPRAAVPVQRATSARARPWPSTATAAAGA